MTMNIYQSEGVVIQAVAFRDYDQIVTLFTPDHGIVKLIIKNGRRKKVARGSCTPLTAVEFSWKEGKGELGQCEEIITIRHYAALRTTLPLMEAGCDLLRAVQKSQPVGKVTPELYQLLLYYLEKLPLTRDPLVLTSSLRLKILRHEGVLGFPFQCSTCQQIIHEAFYWGGALLCPHHSPPLAPRFETNDIALMETLTCCSSYSALKEAEISPHLAKGIALFFEGCLN